MKLTLLGDSTQGGSVNMLTFTEQFNGFSFTFSLVLTFLWTSAEGNVKLISYVNVDELLVKLILS